MPDLPDRLRALDDLEPPDIAERARALGPRPPTEPDGPSPAKRTTVIVFAFLVAVAGVGLLFRAFRQDTTTAPGAAPPAELIAFALGRVPQVPGRFTDIAVAHPDGSHVRRVTGSAADLAEDPWMAKYGFSSDDSPAFSPDGRTIAFVRRYSEGTDSLCTIGLDGSGFRVVVRDLGGAELAWSPDGSMFAYYSERDGGIHVVNEDGSDDHAVLPRGAGTPNQVSPSWSADGSQIFFVQGGVFSVHPDGTGLREVLALSPSATMVAASPDGKTLAFVQGGGARPHVWIAGVDGSSAHQLDLSRPNAGIGSFLTWSPDGGQLLVGGRRSAWLVDRDGRHLRHLQGLEGDAVGAWWGPRASAS